MPGERRVDSDGGCLAVADLANHDDFRILPQEAAQTASKVELAPGARLRLAHPLDDALDRVFNRNNVPPALGRESAQAGVDRRRLAAAARPGEEHRPAAQTQQCLQGSENVRRQTELIQFEQTSRRVEDAHDRLLAVDRRKGTHAPLRRSAIGADAPLLRDVEPIGEQLGHHLEPGNDIRSEHSRQGRCELDHAINAEAYVKRLWGRLEVNVADAEAVRLGEDQVDRLDDAVGTGGGPVAQLSGQIRNRTVRHALRSDGMKVTNGAILPADEDFVTFTPSRRRVERVHFQRGVPARLRWWSDACGKPQCRASQPRPASLPARRLAGDARSGAAAIAACRKARARPCSRWLRTSEALRAAVPDRRTTAA